MDCRYCIAWKKPAAVCCDSRKARCTQPFTGSKRRARSRRTGNQNHTAVAAPFTTKLDQVLQVYRWQQGMLRPLTVEFEEPDTWHGRRMKGLCEGRAGN